VKQAAVLGLISVYVGLFSSAVSTQCSSSIDLSSPAQVRNEVNRIFNQTLDGMDTILPSGVKATTWLPPDDSVRAQVKCLGTVAVPAIVDLLNTTDRSFGHLLTIQMLGWVGGPDIVPPLRRVLLKPDTSLLLKFAAIDSLLAAPPDKALPVVEEVLRLETDPRMQERAAAVAAKLKGEEQH
jgi:hypothetical protein